MKIGIVGKGFVGSAVQFGFSANTGCNADVKVYDKDPSRSQHSLNEVVNDSDFIFLSVPTPSNEDGTINLDIVDQALSEINDVSTKDSVILLRSTMVPGSTLSFQEKYPKLNLVFNPEFLTERSANFDFINQSRFILGGSEKNVKKVAKLYKWRFGKSISIIETNFQTAEMIKYMNNCFFATKVSFMNEMKLVADKCGVDWEMAVEGFIRDGRIGHSHLNVPGHDGKKGFGGTCFPKDINSLLYEMKKVDMDSYILKSVITRNETHDRSENDWKENKGRAIV